MYDFTIVHRSVKYHQNADTLSRRPCCKEGCNNCSRLETKDSSLEQTSETKVCQVSTNLSQGTETEKVCWSPKELKLKEESDPSIRPALPLLKKNKRPTWSDISPFSVMTKVLWAQWDSLCLRDGVLYRRWENYGGTEVSWQLAVPRSMIADVLSDVHNTRTAGHFGITRTLKKLKQYFYWPRCRDDVKRFCLTCELCTSKKRTAQET